MLQIVSLKLCFLFNYFVYFDIIFPVDETLNNKKYSFKCNLHNISIKVMLEN